MILYADTSALIKKYVRETGSEQVVPYFAQYTVIGTNVVTQVEMAAAMSKAVRLGWVNRPEITLAWREFMTHWPAYVRLPASMGILERAASGAWDYSLRAYDSLHLASAQVWRELSDEEVVFACYDQNLIKAARLAGLRVWPESQSRR
jgi:uncharacterized protein